MAFPGQAAVRGPTQAHPGAAWLEHTVPAPASQAKIGEIGGTVTGVSLLTLHDGEKPIQLRQSGSAVETRLYRTGLDVREFGATDASFPRRPNPAPRDRAELGASLAA